MQLSTSPPLHLSTPLLLYLSSLLTTPIVPTHTNSAESLADCPYISSAALQALAQSDVQEVVLMGRRGHVQSSFTIKVWSRYIDVLMYSLHRSFSSLLPPPLHSSTIKM
jgi:hypothetical protein